MVGSVGQRHRRTAAGARNVISANGQYGVIIDNEHRKHSRGITSARMPPAHTPWGFCRSGFSSAHRIIRWGGKRRSQCDLGQQQGRVQIDYAGTTGNVVEGDYRYRRHRNRCNGNPARRLFLVRSLRQHGRRFLAARNVISANGVDGVIIDLGSTANSVEGNHIGTDVTGSYALGNSYGVVIQRGSVANTVGGKPPVPASHLSQQDIRCLYHGLCHGIQHCRGNCMARFYGQANLGNRAMALMSSAGPRLPRSVCTRRLAANLISSITATVSYLWRYD